VLKSSYRKLIPYLLPQRWVFLSATVCLVGFVSSMPLLAQLAGSLTEPVSKGNLGGLSQVFITAIIVFVIRGVFQYGQDSLMAKASLQAITDLRIDLFGHLQSLDLSYFNEKKSGDLAYKLTQDVDRLAEVVRKFFNQFVPSIFTVIFVLGYLLYLNWVLTALTFLVAPLLALSLGWFGSKLQSFSRQGQDLSSDLAGLLTEIFSGIRVIRGFASEAYEIRRFKRLSQENQAARFQAEYIKAVQYPVIAVLLVTAVLSVIGFGTWQIGKGNMNPAQFLSFATGIVLLIDPISISTSNFNELKQAESSADRLFELLAVKPVLVEKPNAVVLPAVEGKVEFENVLFGYKASQPVLKGVSFTVNPGEVVALVGPSGSGKSSLVGLVPRFYDPQSGKVLIDGTDVRDVTFESLRRQIGIVPQETVLFSGTVAENIAYGQDSFDMEDVEKAAKIANAHSFISAFPKGYQTMLGERGTNLSGGQRQRIAIARAVLLDPRILILDEATSALDTESEALVQEALNRLMQGRTVLVVAHRLSTIRQADRILVIEQGDIREAGNHQELMAIGSGLYRQLYERQMQSVG
jgi:ATP-binding cassette, subfamily B, bacterial